MAADPANLERATKGAGWMLTCVGYAEMCLLIGALDQCDVVLTYAERASAERELRWLEPEALRLRGEFHLATNGQGSKQAAADSFAQAIRLARQQGAVMLERRIEERSSHVRRGIDLGARV